MAIARTSVNATRLPRSGRVMRRPQHPFQVRHRPFQIQPFFIAPVLAGETLKDLNWQVRAVTDPIKNRLVGWWLEQYFFYVKLRDLENREAYQQMLLDPAWDSSPYDAAADDVRTYFEAGSTGHINWVRECLTCITDEFFRDEGDVAADFVLDTMPLAKVTGTNVLHSVAQEADVTFPDVAITVGVDDQVTYGEIDAARQQYEFLRQNMAVDMSYEDYLAMFGVRRQQVEIHRPELIRFARNWQYPVAAISPTDGSSVAAVQWSVSERADKDRFFTEPGFLFGVQVARPKIYMGSQSGSFTAHMEDAFSWLPAVLNDDPRTSLKLIPDNDGPLGDVTDAGGYWVDMKDLFMHGEQFVNFAMTATDDNSVALPTAAMQKWYPVSADVDALFNGASPNNVVRCDGIVQLNIAGRLQDTSS